MAAALYAINVPISKLFIEHVGTTMMAGLLYFGAGIGMSIYVGITKAVGKARKKEPLTRKDLPYTIAMVILDIVAPFLGVAFSMLLIGELPNWQFYLALLIMIVSIVIMVKDTIELQHTHEHEHTHTHAHSHGDLVHTHEHTHIHIHAKDENIHTHKHNSLENHDHVHVLDA